MLILISLVRKNIQTNRQTDKQTYATRLCRNNMPLGLASPGPAAINECNLTIDVDEETHYIWRREKGEIRRAGEGERKWNEEKSTWFLQSFWADILLFQAKFSRICHVQLLFYKGKNQKMLTGKKKVSRGKKYALSPEGTLQSRYQSRSNCFNLCLILC